MSTNIAEIVRTSKASRSDLHKAFSEGGLLNHYVLPAIHAFLSQLDGMDADTVRESLLSESYREMRAYASGTPARLSRHPFEKVIGASAQSVVRRWKSTNPRVKSYPDLALRSPCPYRAVFEGKYFSRGGLTAAETALATNIYQAFLSRTRQDTRNAVSSCLGLRVCLRARLRRYSRWVDAPEDRDRMLGGGRHLRDDPSRTAVKPATRPKLHLAPGSFLLHGRRPATSRSR
jgi:hypothetical protein